MWLGSEKKKEFAGDIFTWGWVQIPPVHYNRLDEEKTSLVSFYVWF
jgi:hypothetical protein